LHCHLLPSVVLLFKREAGSGIYIAPNYQISAQSGNTQLNCGDETVTMSDSSDVRHLGFHQEWRLIILRNTLQAHTKFIKIEKCVTQSLMTQLNFSGPFLGMGRKELYSH